MGKETKSEAAILRQKAEELLKKKPSKSRVQLSEGEMQKLIHDLEVHQIELEMQNEELVLAKEQIAKLAAIEKATDGVSEFAENIINTVREPLLVLDQDLRVVKASRSFYNFFKVTAIETIGKLIYDLGNNQWDIPKLRELLETILPQKTTFDDYEVEHNFSIIGKRVMLLNARQIKRAFGKEKIILLVIEDITERKSVEESLSEESRMSSEYLDILLDHTHAPIIIWDSSLVIKRFNHQFEKLSGYNSTEVIDRKIDILFPKDKIDSTLELLNNHLSDEDSEVIEVDILTKDNDIKTVLWNSANILDKEGTNTVATIAQDITRRKRTEEALGILETRYRRLFESAKDGILILDAETGKIIDVNPFLMELLGYSKEEMTGKEIWEIGFFKDIAANKEKFAELRQREYVRYDNLPLETASGRRINVEFVSNVYLVSINKVIQCNIRDITDRKKAEEELQESELRFRTLYDNAKIGLYRTTFDGNILMANKALIKMLGYSSFEKLAERNLEKEGYGPTYQRKEFVEMIEKDGVINDFECAWVRLDGTVFFVRESAQVIRNSNGKILYYDGVVEDITDRKRAQESLKEKEHEFRILAESMPQMVWITQPDGWNIYFNQQWLDYTGQTLEESYCHGWNKPFHPDDQQRAWDAWQSATKNIAVYSIESRLRRADGVYNWFLVRGVPLLDEHGTILKWFGTCTDINEIKLVEESLKNQKDEFETIFNLVPAQIWYKDTHNNFIRVNQQVCKDIGMTNDQIEGHSAEELFPLFAQQYFKDDLEIFNTRKPKLGINEQVNTATGEIRWVHTDKVPIFGNDGEANGLIAFIQDITERKHVDEALQESEALYRNLVLKMPDGVYKSTHDGKFVNVNPAMIKILGYNSKEEILAIDIKTELYFEPADRESIILMEQLEEMGIYRLKKKDGSAIWVEDHGWYNLDENGDIISHEGILRDITERKHAEDEITMLAHSLKNINECISITDLEDKIIFVNESFLKTYGYELNELIGENISLVRSQSNEQGQLDEILPATIQGEWKGELMNRKKDGTEFPVYLSTTIIKDKENKVLGLIGVATDVSMRKLAETELIIAKEKAQESDRLKSAFLANMSHEVRTPLNSIIGFSELLAHPDFEEDQKNEFIQHIIVSGNNLLTIISDIMDISKLESGELKIRKGQINARKFISTVKEQYAFQAKENGLELKLVLPEHTEETIIVADVERLWQIFNNLMSNALKFTANGRIEIGYQPLGKMVEFFVKDTGIGIPASYHETIFDRFRQVDSEITRKFGGNGLGLAISKNLIELMGGKIRLESEPGIGSVFYFTLPT